MIREREMHMSNPLELKNSPVMEGTGSRAWKALGRAQQTQHREAWIWALVWGSMLLLIAPLGGSGRMTYDVAVQCLLTGGAASVMVHAFHRRQYSLAAVFAGLALLYSPVAPLSGSSVHWQNFLVTMIAAPFIASMAVPGTKVAHVG
jgi:hypothetical protein